MRPIGTAGNSGEMQGMTRKKEMEGRLAECQLWCEKKIKDMGYIDAAEKEAIKAIQKYPDKFFELKSGDISPELLASLIKKITVVSQEQIEITYAYSDIIEKWCEEAQLFDKKGGWGK